MRVALNLLLVVLLASCGRTSLVRYTVDGSVLFEDIGEFTDAGVDGGTDAGVDAGVVRCMDGRFQLTPALPVVGLVLDRSASMAQTFGSGTTSKWSALRTALAGALPPVDQTMELGAMLFPANSASCTVPSGFNVAPAKGSVETIISLVNRSNPGGSTPTALSVEAAAMQLLNRRAAGTARALVLATDGAPDCNTSLNPRMCTCVGGPGCTSAIRCLDDTRTIERIGAALSSGIPTYVIGIRSTTDASLVAVLDRMAVAGGRPQAGSQRFFSATSTAELSTAFSTIRDQVGACSFLTVSVPDAMQGGIELSINGAKVPFDEAGLEGWTWADRANGEVRFAGNACTQAQQFPASIEAVVACEPRDAGVPDAGLPMPDPCGCTDQLTLLPSPPVTEYVPTLIGTFPAGQYCWRWVGGAIQYADDPCWVVSAVDPAFRIVDAMGSIVSTMPGGAGCPATQALAEAAFTGTPQRFSWQGGPLSIVLFDSNFAGNRAGSPSSQFRMCRVAP